MAATGTIPIGGKEYTWTSPTFAELEHIEANVGPLNAIVNTVQGRIHLLVACLKDGHPDITPGVLGKELRATDWDAVWDTLKTAVPLWELPKAEEDAGRKQPSESATPSGDGDPPKPGESA